MKLVDFCSSRNIQTQTVGKYIERHPEIFTGHISKDGKLIVLDEIAEKILAEKYQAKPIPISEEETRLLKKIEDSQNFIIHLQQEIIQKDKILLETQNNLAVLEYKNQELEELKEDNKKLGNSVFDLEKQNQDLLKELESVKKEKERLENRNFFQRLFNK